MDPGAERDRLRELSSDQRTAMMQLRIDAGFVNHRKILPLIGSVGATAIERQIAQLPEMPDGLRAARVDGLYSDFLLGFCRELGAPTLGELLGGGKGQIFCSTPRRSRRRRRSMNPSG